MPLGAAGNSGVVQAEPSDGQSIVSMGKQSRGCAITVLNDIKMQLVWPQIFKLLLTSEKKKKKTVVRTRPSHYIL